MIALAMADRWPRCVDVEQVRTNIVCAAAARLPDHFVERLGEHGVLGGTIDPRTVRLVTHAEIDDDAVTATIDAFDAIRAG